MSTSTNTDASTGGGFLERATELRMIIAILFAVYGVVCLIWSGFTTPQELQKAAGINVNLWTGIGMLVVALLFFLWAVLKPLGVEDSSDDEHRSELSANDPEPRGAQRD